MAKKKQRLSAFQKLAIAFYLSAVLFAVNFVYQMVRNPLHVFSFFSHPLRKTHQETWHSYSDIFRKYGDVKITPSLLAAIAQVESAGNPLAAPEWRFQFTTDVADIFAPASTSFGLMQITKGTFDLMMRQCENNCPQMGLATRARATDSVRLSASFIRQSMEDILGQKRFWALNEENTTRLASVIHLCGPEIGRRLAQNGFRVERLPRCAAHWPETYVQKIKASRKMFEQMSRNENLIGKN